MAYSNFIPTVWSEGINRELERLCVFAEDCNRQYEGKIKKAGESITILGVGKPTIQSLSKTDRNTKLSDPEEIEDTSVIMLINQYKTYNYMVGDIDKAQEATTGIMEALSLETSEALANEIDTYIAGFAVDSNVKSLYSTAPKLVAHETTNANEKYVLDVLDEAIQYLQEKDVGSTTKVVVTVSPRFYRLFKRAYITKDTDNSGIIKNGKVATYGNITVKMSNNVKRSGASNAVDNIMMRTQRAVAFAKPLTHSEAYRPESRFADAVKGYILFDAKVVRPKEVVNINVKYA